MTQIKKYFRNLLRNHEEDELKQLFLDLVNCRNKVTRDLRRGQIEVNEQQTNLDQFLKMYKEGENQNESKSRRLLLQKQIESLNREDFESDEAYKRAKQVIILRSQEEIKQEKQERERLRKQMEEKVKRWTEQQKQLLKKKQAKSLQQQKIREKEQKKSKEQAQNEKKAALTEKRRQIEENLRVIEQNRTKREEMIRSMRSQSQDRLPLYMEYERRAKQLQDEIKFQQNIQKKNHKIAMKIDYQNLKNHERLFLTKIEQRNQKFEEERARASSSLPDSPFNVFTNRSPEKMKEELQKKNRRWKYQEKIKEIPIQIDESKKVKIEIALDKAKNPFKYNFLSQKSLNQFQIFGQFKNFSINADAKQIGKSYLQQLKKIPKQSRVERTSSVQLIKESAVSDRPQYRNYLAELKSKKGQIKEQKDEVKKIIATFKNKEQAVKELQKKSLQLDNDVAEKMRELKHLSSHNIKTILKKESQIDEVYAKALKARLACLEISS